MGGLHAGRSCGLSLSSCCDRCAGGRHAAQRGLPADGAAGGVWKGSRRPAHAGAQKRLLVSPCLELFPGVRSRLNRSTCDQSAYESYADATRTYHLLSDSHWATGVSSWRQRTTSAAGRRHGARPVGSKAPRCLPAIHLQAIWSECISLTPLTVRGRSDFRLAWKPYRSLELTSSCCRARRAGGARHCCRAASRRIDCGPAALPADRAGAQWAAAHRNAAHADHAAAAPAAAAELRKPLNKISTGSRYPKKSLTLNRSAFLHRPPSVLGAWLCDSYAMLDPFRTRNCWLQVSKPQTLPTAPTYRRTAAEHAL